MNPEADMPMGMPGSLDTLGLGAPMGMPASLDTLG